MKKSSLTVRRLTSLMLGAATLLAGCSVWEELAHQKDTNFRTCVTIGDPAQDKFVPANMRALLPALAALGENQYFIRINDGQGNITHSGHLPEPDPCCGGTTHRRKHVADSSPAASTGNAGQNHILLTSGIQPYSGNVTQNYKISSSTPENVVKAIVDALNP